jgi:hypothetical protein
MAHILRLDGVRLTFPKIFDGQAEQYQGKGAKYYNASFIIDPAQQPEVVKKIKDAVAAVAAEKFKDGAAAQLKVFSAKDKLPLHDGDLKADKPYGAAYKGKVYVSARNNADKNPAPPVFDNVKDPATGQARRITSPADAKAPYSGCYVNAQLELFYYKANGGEGIGASIRGVQFHEHGERLAGGGVASASDFAATDAVEDTEEGADASSLF